MIPIHYDLELGDMGGLKILVHFFPCASRHQRASYYPDILSPALMFPGHMSLNYNVLRLNTVQWFSDS